MKRLLVGTLAYRGHVTTDYLFTLLQLSKLTAIDIAIISNESNVRRGRNKIFTYFMKNKEQFTHLLILDADVGVDPQGIIKMMNADKDIIGAPIRVRNSNQVALSYDEILDDSQKPLLKVGKLGTGVMLISSKVVDKILENEDKFETYKPKPHDTLPDGTKPEKIYDLFKTGVINGYYESTDYYFCHLMRSIGIEIWADLSISNVHEYHTKLRWEGLKE